MVADLITKTKLFRWLYTCWKWVIKFKKKDVTYFQPVVEANKIDSTLRCINSPIRFIDSPALPLGHGAIEWIEQNFTKIILEVWGFSPVRVCVHWWNDKNAKADDSPIPSKSLVPLQFAPWYPYAKTAQNFTSRLNIQYKIERRQVRLSHPMNTIAMPSWSISKREPLNRNKICYSFVTKKQMYRLGTLIIWYQQVFVEECPLY